MNAPATPQDCTTVCIQEQTRDASVCETGRPCSECVALSQAGFIGRLLSPEPLFAVQSIQCHARLETRVQDFCQPTGVVLDTRPARILNSTEPSTQVERGLLLGPYHAPLVLLQ